MTEREGWEAERPWNKPLTPSNPDQEGSEPKQWQPTDQNGWQTPDPRIEGVPAW